MYDYQVDHEAILRILGQGNTSTEYKTYLMGYILPLFDQRLTLRFEDELAGQDLMTFKSIEDRPDQVRAFVQQHFPNRSQIYNEELTKFITELQPRPAGTPPTPDDDSDTFDVPLPTGNSTGLDGVDDTDIYGGPEQPLADEPAQPLDQPLEDNDEGVLNLHEEQPALPQTIQPTPTQDEPRELPRING